jgi:purine-nucleoside phosphorylase
MPSVEGQRQLATPGHRYASDSSELSFEVICRYGMLPVFCAAPYRHTDAHGARALDAIVKPVTNKHSPRIRGPVVMAATRPDLDDLRRHLNLGGEKGRPLYTGRFYPATSRSAGLTGPLIGAPQAVMVLETLAAWGADTVVFMGWCGAISPDLHIGDIVLADRAIIDEGTSRHYGQSSPTVARPSTRLAGAAESLLKAVDVPLHTGTIWTTDAIYRETETAVRRYRGQGALAVEMETSALFSAAAYRRVELISILVVSDELSTLTWRPGFKDPRFRRGRLAACRAVARLMASVPKDTGSEIR